jgi:hypothetical protein
MELVLKLESRLTRGVGSDLLLIARFSKMTIFTLRLLFPCQAQRFLREARACIR